MRFFQALLDNFPLVCAGVGWFTAQFMKVFTGIFRQKTFNVVELLFGTGGMPSSHTAAVCALTVACGMSCGLDSPVFAVSLLFTVVVMRDATGVRGRLASRQRSSTASCVTCSRPPEPRTSTGI